MVQIAGEIVIRRPVEVVFDTLGDPRREWNYNDRVRAAQMLTPGPIAVGSRFEQQVRAFGRTDRATIDITRFERPSRLALTIKFAAMETLGDLQFEEVPEGTHATYAWDMRARGAARLFEPLLGLFGARWSAACGKVSDGSWRGRPTRRYRPFWIGPDAVAGAPGSARNRQSRPVFGNPGWPISGSVPASRCSSFQGSRRVMSCQSG